MEFIQLHYFQTVARLEHMTKAAEELQIAQPSLSKTIARLENDLGVHLFDRKGRQIRLNPFGKAFLARVERAFMELNEGKRELNDLAGLHEGTVTLAVTIPRILPELLGAFLTQFPHVRLRQLIESTSSMRRLLENGEIDLCISSIPIEGSDIEWKPLMTEEIFLLAPPEHRLADRDAISLSEVKDEPFISMNEGYGFRNLTDAFCREAGFTPNIAFEGDEPNIIGSLVRKGLGVAFVPALSLPDTTVPSPVRLRITSPACHRTIGMAWSKSRYLSQAAGRFQQFIVDYFAKLNCITESIHPEEVV
ncbi:LysR family transcriptional regulator [Paenibacillus alginolyticus]|uniref:LysR family transcriptional regulator n=1 Tax=Paenibacillus alginolyticus TaxID=59839 RepID=UPI000424E05B|nr:LysR family transcriptional regulator [Paenibacillus alginolyticus]MCY9669781.1 LysR family transcriptional regulator [Paenibacillus alginolyticus]